MAPDRTDGPLDFDEDSEDAARRARPALRQGPEQTAEARPTRGPTQAEPPERLLAGASRHGWFVGIVGVLILALVTLNASRTEGPGSPALTPGGAAPPFAAPLALSALDGDVNVAGAANSGDAGAVPACSVRRRDVLNLCALYQQGPVVLAFFATRGGECVEQLDELDAVSARHPGVRFAAVSIRGDRDALRRTIRERRWRFPVGYDRDGILADAYGVAVCPQITFLREGGAVQGTSLGAIGTADLEARVRRLEE